LSFTYFSHSSGFPDLDATYIPIARGLGSLEITTPMSSWNDFILHINGARNEQFSDPDINFFYNNDFFTILGLIVEKVSGMKFEKYVKDKILKPLGMQRTIYTREDFEKDENKLKGYIRSGDGEFKAYDHPFDEKIYAAGGLLSSAREMGNYIKALLNDGKLNGTQIIQKYFLDQMWGKYTKMPEETSYVLFKEAFYGYAWMIENFFDYKMVHHGGDILTSSGQLSLIPDQNLGIFIGANMSIGPVLSSLCCGIFAIFLGKDINEAVPLLSVDQKLSKLAGKYETYKGIIKVELEYKNGLLSGKISHPALIEDLKFPLAPLDIDNLKFYVPVCLPNQKIFVQFFIDEKTGKIHGTVDRYYLHKV
jgi:CubicO group peptidase (beta-lactamase class C family)